MKEFNIKIALPLVLMFMGLLVIFVLGAYLLDKPLSWPEDYILFLFLPINLVLIYSGRKKLVLPLLEFLDTDLSVFEYKGFGKLEERVVLGAAQINFNFLKEALENTDFTLVYANEEKGLIKLKQELKVFKNTNAFVIQLSADEVLLHCYSFSGRIHPLTRKICKEMVDLMAVLKTTKPSQIEK